MEAATRVPITVALGMVFSGSTTSPAGTVADSMPRKANIVSGATAARAPMKGLSLGFSTAKVFQSTQNKPNTPIAVNGTSLV